MSLRPVTITLREANAYVNPLHRHNGPLPGAKFAIAAVEPTSGVVRGVAIAGVPKAQAIGSDWRVLEVNRVCTEGYRNACSFLYGCCVRAAKALGYWRIITYTLPTESGSSLKASGWSLVDETAGGGAWTGRPGRTAPDSGRKLRWEIQLADPAPSLAWPENVTSDASQLPLEGLAA